MILTHDKLSLYHLWLHQPAHQANHNTQSPMGALACQSSYPFVAEVQVTVRAISTTTPWY
jgi:hypothetical protein